MKEGYCVSLLCIYVCADCVKTV